MNDTAARMLGKSREALNYVSFMGFISKSSKSIFHKHFKKTFNSDEKQIIEIEIINTNNRKYWLELHSKAYFDHNRGVNLCRTIAVDITDKKYQEKTLLQSEEKFKKYFYDDKSIKLLINLKTGEIADANKSATEFYGYSYEKLVKMNINQINQLSMKEVTDKMKSVKKFKQQIFNFQHKTADGSIKDVEVYSTPIEFDNNSYLLSTIFDLTEKNRIKNKLEESEERFELALKGANDGLFDWDLKSDYLFLSPRWKGILGYEDYELENHFSTWDKLTHPTDKKYAWEKFNQYIAGKANRYEVEFRMKHKKGHWIPILSRAYKKTDESGKAIRLIGTHMDLSELRNVERQLKESKEILELFFNQSIYGFIIVLKDEPVDWNNVKNKKEKNKEIFDKSKIIKINDAFANQYQLHRDEILGKSPAAFNNTDKISGYELNLSLLNNSEIKAIIEQHRKDDSTFWTEVNYKCLFDDESNITGYVGIHNDITAQVINEKEIKETNKKLTELNEIKNRFFSIIAHDLTNPFNSIIGFSDLMVRDTNLNDDNKEMAFHINNTAKQAFELLKDLLTWARFQSDRLVFHPTEFYFFEIIDSVLPVLRSSAVNKEIELSKNIDKSIYKNKVKADKNMMKTILRNLLSNAIKYTNRKGKIYIEATVNSNKFSFSVIDNGIGIPKEDIKKLFDLDSKIRTDGTEKEKGTGLGLKLCKEFTTKHNGTIEVKSELEKGSEFKVTIPF